MGEKKIKMTLHPKEAALINRIRTDVQFGKIEIYTRDALPHRILKITMFDDLEPLGEDEL